MAFLGGTLSNAAAKSCLTVVLSTSLDVTALRRTCSWTRSSHSEAESA
jgi:hypothetical protein